MSEIKYSDFEPKPKKVEDCTREELEKALLVEAAVKARIEFQKYYVDQSMKLIEDDVRVGHEESALKLTKVASRRAQEAYTLANLLEGIV